MTLTDTLKAELLSLPAPPTAIRAAELATLLRFAGGLHRISGRMAVEVEVESKAIADRVASRRRLMAQFAWSGAAVTALMFFVAGTNWQLGCALLLVDLGFLLPANGVLDRLKAGGATVTSPVE